MNLRHCAFLLVASSWVLSVVARISEKEIPPRERGKKEHPVNGMEFQPRNEKEKRNIKPRPQSKPKPHISGGGIKRFKAHYAIRNNTNITLQSISQNNTLVFQNVEYTLDDLKPMEIISSKYYDDGNAASSSPLLEKMVNGTRVSVVMDGDQIAHICFQNERGRADLIPLRKNETASDIPVYATVNLEDYDVEALDTTKTFDEMQSAKTMDYGKSYNHDDGYITAAKSMKCEAPKIIEVAIAHDNTLCKEFDGSKTRTNAHIQAIVGLASTYYESSCVKLSLSHIDGTCDSSKDPYKTIAKSKDILEDFTKEWRAKKGNVKRDVAHLFSGSSFESGVLGWAWKGTLCSKKNAYGANWISWSDNIALRASLFAHELAHNAGASHFGKDCSNWLMAPCGSGLSGLSQESQSAVTSYLSKQTCLHRDSNSKPDATQPLQAPPVYVQPPIQITPPLPRTSTPFEIRSKVVSSQCLTFNNDLIILSECINSKSQRWTYNQALKHIVNIAEGKCLVPKVDDTRAKRIRLTLKSCPGGVDTLFQWSFSNKMIVNKKSFNSGINEVIEATRAIKKIYGKESVVFVPTLALFNNSKVDLQTWNRIHLSI